MNVKQLWITWAGLTLSVAGYFVFALNVENTEAKRTLLPGMTTHGHYQIELACNACHTEFMGVKQDACVECHGADLKQENDTHPASKFNDPTNADRLAKINAQACITCHREHVPDRTKAMGLSLPADYCFHCHEDVAEQRPSHEGMKHDSCATAGCHNYHDNRALYENFLFTNCDQPDVKDLPRVPLRELTAISAEPNPFPKSLLSSQADAPLDLKLPEIVAAWTETAHAQSGVNCRACHDVETPDQKLTSWQNKVERQACEKCHEYESQSFLKGRHGMRLAEGMSPMKPGMARLPMHEENSHKELNCSACHEPHRYDSKFAAVEACIGCHNDQHTKSYLESSHYRLWKEESNGAGEAGSGVSCATCHMPRVEVDDKVHVQHNQNYNLRPNEKMIRSVCMNCHGLEFSLNSLADPALIKNCFQGQPAVEVDSAQMAKRWFEEKERKRQLRKQK